MTELNEARVEAAIDHLKRVDSDAHADRIQQVIAELIAILAEK